MQTNPSKDEQSSGTQVQPTSSFLPPSPVPSIPQVETPLSEQSQDRPAGETKLPGFFELLRSAWEILKKDLGSYLAIASVPMILQLGLFLLSAISDRQPEWLSESSGSVWIITILLIALITTAIIMSVVSSLALVQVADNRESGIKFTQAYKIGFERLFPYLWTAFLSSAIVMGALFFFIIPGLIFSLWFVLITLVVALEKEKGIRALVKSREYVRGYWGAVFVRRLGFSLMMFLLLIPQMIAEAVLGRIYGELVSGIAGVVFSIPFFLLVTPLFVIFDYLIYSNLKKIKGEGEISVTRRTKAGYILLAIFGMLVVPLALISLVLLALNSTKKPESIGKTQTIQGPVSFLEKAKDLRVKQTTVIVQKALEFYFAKRGFYPEELDELIPTELTENPFIKEPKITYTYKPLIGGKEYELCVELSEGGLQCADSKTKIE